MSIQTRKRTPSRSVEDTEAGWLLLVESGMSSADVAREAGVSHRRVQQGIADARRRESPQGSADSSRRDPESTPAFGSRNPMAVPIYGPRPFTRADLKPIEIAVDSPRLFVLAGSPTPAPRTVLRPGEDGTTPPEHPKACPHNGPLPHGSVCYCEDCAAYGRPWDKRLVIDERERPKREPKPAPPVQVEKPKPEKTSGKMRRRKAKRAMQGAA